MHMPVLAGLFSIAVSLEPCPVMSIAFLSRCSMFLVSPAFWGLYFILSFTLKGFYTLIFPCLLTENRTLTHIDMVSFSLEPYMNVFFLPLPLEFYILCAYKKNSLI